MTLSFAAIRSLPTAGLSARVMRAIMSLGRAWSHRLQVQQLLTMDDRALKDIGLTRSDVVGALELSLDRDPSTLLVVKSVERRARARRPAFDASGPRLTA